MEWSHDFCLSCDRQISQPEHGAYCSQACRLADLERASNSSSGSSLSSQASWSSTQGPTNGFYLPPALNFSSYSTSSRHPPSASPSPASRSPMSATAPSHHYPQQSSYSDRKPSQLYTSPSRTSLSSLHSYGQQPESGALSDKVKSELRDYAGSFDHVRDWKRRMTVV